MAPSLGKQSVSPSSFPGIYKYPSRRETSENPVDWLAGKRADDDIGNYWRVHDGLYNLDDFIGKHPGGAIWLEITRGTDITEAFESSHVVNMKSVEHALSAFYVGPAKSPRMSPYTFNENGFYRTLRAKVAPILKNVGTGPSMYVRAVTDLLVSTAFFLCFLGVVKNSMLWSALSGAVLAFMAISVHNFLHLRDNFRAYYWDLTLLSSYEWRISHSLSHHLYPNTIMDFEVSMFEPLLEFFPKKGKSHVQRYLAGVYYHWILLTFFLKSFLTRCKRVITGVQPFRRENLFPFIELVVILTVAPSFWTGLRGWLVMHCAASYVLLLIGINAAHHHPDIFHEGDEARPDPDFGLCQMDAVRDRPGNFTENLFIVLITFGNHSLHHLFPAVCHSKLVYLNPVLNEHVKKYGEQFLPMTQWELFKGCLRQLARIETRNLNDKKKS